MQTRTLGSTDLQLSAIGLGTWALGGGGWKYSWGSQDKNESIATIRRALELGINWIDTAPVYGLGTAEEVVGTALKEIADKQLVATKCGLVWDASRNISFRLKKESIRVEVEASLKRLNREAIDLYQIHWPNPDQDIGEAWSIIADLVKQGKVRYAGASNFSVAQLKRVQAIHPVASLQPPYSMLERGVEKQLLEYCASQSIGVIVYSPLQKGILTGKLTTERVQRLPEDDHRRNDPLFQEPQLTAHLELVKELRAVADESHHTVAQLAIAWVLRRSEVTAAIVGARRPSQIEETARAGTWQLSEEQMARIEELLREAMTR